MKRLRPFLYTIGASIAGLAALGLTVTLCGVGVVETLPYLSPGAIDEDAQPRNLVGKLAFWAVGCFAGMVGGYVATWVASRAKQSGLHHAMLVGLVAGVVAVLSNNEEPPPSWVLLARMLATLLLSTVLGGWVRLRQNRKRALRCQVGNDDPTKV